MDFLSRNVFGNTHSVSNRSSCANEARAAVLSFFRAPAEEYSVIFTPNASGVLKLVGESYLFTCESRIRGGARRWSVLYSFDIDRGARGHCCSCAFINPSILSSIANLTWLRKCYSDTNQSRALRDAAALVATSTISLTDYPVDAMAISFYKMFGFPTGVGALVAKKSFLRRLQRPWFAGGNVDFVQVLGTIVTLSHVLHEQFEDGTINYLSLSAVTDGLRFISAYMPFLPPSLSSLLQYLISSLNQLRHDTTDTPVVRVLSAVPSRRLTSVGAQSDPSGEMLPNSFIAHATSQMCMSLRMECMCNTGGAAALLGSKDLMQHMYEGVGRELRVVRVSLGPASNFQDAWNFLRFAKLTAQEEGRKTLGWLAFICSSSTDIAWAADRKKAAPPVCIGQ
ncbi:pyridoxal phosphate-dependent transferase [Mycena leptocephala]|nr:pyridoxal phosphate-dependent transferase [Mycena leptocephala]